MSNLAVSTIPYISPVDRLGELKADIARLTATAKLLEDAIKEDGVGAYEGDLFRAAVSEVAERQSLCAKAAEAKLRELGVDGRWFSKNQKTTKGYIVVRVSARKA